MTLALNARLTGAEEPRKRQRCWRFNASFGPVINSETPDAIVSANHFPACRSFARRRNPLDLLIPGQDLHVSSERSEQDGHDDVYVALRDTFDAARRLLQDRTREQRGQVKRHSMPPAPG